MRKIRVLQEGSYISRKAVTIIVDNQEVPTKQVSTYPSLRGNIISDPLLILKRGSKYEGRSAHAESQLSIILREYRQLERNTMEKTTAPCH